MTRMTWPLARPAHLFILARLTLVSALAVAFVGLFGGEAQAATSYCVVGDSAAACPLGSQQVADLPDAIALVPSGGGASTVYVTSGTHVAEDGFDLGNKPIHLIGVGPTRPVLTSQVTAPGGAVVQSLNSLTRYQNIAIGIAAGAVGMTGIRTSVGGQAITDVNINGAAASQSTGIELAGSNPSIQNVEIVLDSPAGDSTAVAIERSTTARLLDLRISSAARGITIHDSDDFEVRRTKISAADGLSATNSTGTISSSLVELPKGVSGTAVAALADAETAHNVNVFNCTLVHPGNGGGTGIRSAARGTVAAQSVRVDSSIINGFGYLTFFADGTSESPAELNVRHSWFDGGSSGAGGSLSITQSHGGVTNYGFVNAAAGDFTLRLDSPLVDAGNPIVGDFSQADSESDLAGNPRIVARKGGRVRDVGAYEVQNSGPVPVIEIVTTTPSTTAPTRFSAARSSDPEGDALSFAWSFDSVPAFGDVTASKQFLSPGPHTVRLSVSDSNGSVAHISRQFEVESGHLRMTLSSRTVRLSASGTFKLTLQCPVEAISDCTGRLQLQTTWRIDAQRYKKKAKKKKQKRKAKHRARSSAAKHLRAVDHFFRVAPGVTRTVEVSTSSTFQLVLAQKGKLKLTGVVSEATTINANLNSNRTTYTVLAPRKKR